MKASLASLRVAATVFELTVKGETELQVAVIFRYDDDYNSNNSSPKEMWF